jgi:hypothetical protein
MKAVPIHPGRPYRVTEYATNRWMDIIAANGSEAIARFVAALYNI